MATINRVKVLLFQQVHEARRLLAEAELHQRVQLAVAIGIIGVCAVIVPQIILKGGRTVYLLGLPFALLGVLILLRWPDIGLSLLIISSQIVPYGIGTGTQTSLNATFLLAFALVGLWIFRMIATREIGYEKGLRSVWPSLAFMVSAVISLGFGQFHWFPTNGASINSQIGGLMIMLLSFGIFLMMMFHLQHISSLHWVVGLFIALSGIYVVANLIPGIGPTIESRYTRIVDESMFWCWFAVIGFSQAAFNKSLKTPVRALVAVLVLIALYLAWFEKEGWTSGWLPMLAALAICAIVARPKLVVPALIAVVVVLVLNSQKVSDVMMAGDNQYSLMTRLAAWKTLAQIAVANPIFGLGPANYYWYTMLFPILGYNVVFNSHNNYVDIILQNGLVGLGLLFWFYFEIGREIFAAIREAPEGFERSFLYSVFGGLGATIIAGMFGDWVLPFVYNIGMEGFRSSMLPWLFLGAGAAIARRILRAKRLAAQAASEQAAHGATLPKPLTQENLENA